MEKLVWLPLGFFAITATNALAYCSAPNMYEAAPNEPYASRPSAPFCLMNYSFDRTHTCSEWELRNYIDEVNSYIESMNQYAQEAVNFANAAIEFANQAQDYAACEAQAAKEELE